MATTVISVSSFQTVCAECADAIEDGDFTTAYIKYAKAEAINVGLELSAGDGETNYRRREALNGLKEAIKAAEASSNAATATRLIRTCTRHAS